MKYVSWNCKGLGNTIKVQAVKDLLKMAPAEILLLQETNIGEDALLLLSKNNWNFSMGKVVSAKGTCGGLATLWNEKNFILTNFYVTQHWIFTELLHIDRKISIALFNLYVPVNYSEKQVYWRTLSDFLESCSLANIILAGNLNIVLAPNEKKGDLRGKDFMQDIVENLIHDWKLIDLKTKQG